MRGGPAGGSFLFMNEIQKTDTSVQVFNNSSFGEIRTSWIKEEPYFYLVDLCRILDLDNVSRVRSRLDERGLLLVPTLTESRILKKPAEKFGSFTKKCCTFADEKKATATANKKFRMYPFEMRRGSHWGLLIYL